MTPTHPATAVAVLVIAGFAALGCAFFACSAGAARDRRMRHLMYVLTVVAGVIVGVLAAAGSELL